MRALSALFVALAAAGGLASAQVRVSVLTLEGESKSGMLAALGEDGSIRLATDAGNVDLPAARVVSIEFPDAAGARTPRPGSMLFRLQSGDLIYGSLDEDRGDTIRVTSPGLGTVALQLDLVRSIRVLENASGLPEGLGDSEKTDQDLVFLRGPSGVDKVAGLVSKVTRTGILIDCALGKDTKLGFQKDRIAAIRLANGEAPKEPPDLLAIIRLSDGTSLTGRASSGDAGSLRVKLTAGPTLSVKASEIEQIGFKNGDFRYLSDMEPAAVVETPYIEGDVLYGLRKDRSVSGGPIDIGGKRFWKGLGVHTRTEVTYSLGGKFSRFTAAVGLDQNANTRGFPGSARFRVVVDGKQAYESPVLHAGEAPHWIRNVDVKGADKLTLVADFGDSYHVNGRASFGAAMVVK